MSLTCLYNILATPEGTQLWFGKHSLCYRHSDSRWLFSGTATSASLHHCAKNAIYQSFIYLYGIAALGLKFECYYRNKAEVESIYTVQ